MRMSATIPTTEPASPRAGDTWRWQLSVPAYPAPTWTLTYILINADAKIALTSSPEGAAHRISVPAATTAAYMPGRYDYIAHVSDGTDRYQVGAGVMRVLPDVAEAASADLRSHARKVLQGLDALIEGRASDGDLDVVRTAIGAATTEYSPEQLLVWRRHYAALVAQEDDAAAAARGDVRRRFISARFTR